jgi:hypothetical protein
MRVKIDEKWWNSYVREQIGKTNAEKSSRAERIFSSPGRKWANRMNEKKGKWLDVETEFLFEDQFNTGHIRVMVKHIDGIDFKPEFENIDEFQAAVQERYNKDWPGSKVDLRVLRSYIKSGFIKVF